MRTTSNPAIRNLLTSSGSMPLSRKQPSGKLPPYLAQPTGGSRPITVDDIVVKTAIALATIVAVGFLTVYLGLQVLVLPAIVVGLGVGLFLTFRPRPSAVLTLVYSAAEGVGLGGATSFFDGMHPGVATEAVIGTFSVFVAMLISYRTRVLRLTARRVKWLFGAGVGVLILVLANAVAAFVFNVDLGLRDGGFVAAVLSAVFICVAAFGFLLTFEAADRMIRHGVSADWAWYVAFGLAMTLVWLYYEFLRLATFFR